MEESNQAARDNAGAATEARDQLLYAERKHAEAAAEFKSQLAETRATIATLQKTQDALIARVEPVQELKSTPLGNSKKS